MEFWQTGVFATQEEVDEIESRNHVWVLIPPQREESVQEAAHRIALKHGLPDVPGYYGINTETREFLKAGGTPPDEDQEGRTE